MSNVLKLSGPLKVGTLTADPSNPQEGYIYFNSTSGSYRFYENGSFRSISAEEIASLGALIGTLDGTPTNYTPTEASVSGHLQGIDAALASAGTVDSVNGQTGVIVLDTDDISEGVTNLYHTAARAKAAAVVNSTAGSETDQAPSVSAIKSYVNTQADAKVADAITDGITTVAPSQNAVFDALALKEDAANKGVAGGYASLDGGGKIPASQLPNSVMELKGEWNASTNSPSLADGIGNIGDVYEVTVAGSQNLGSGAISFAVGDWAVYSGSGVWYKSLNSNAVTSVNGFTGTVVLDADDISDAATTNKFVTSAQKTLIDNSIQPSDNISTLTNDAGYIASLVEDTTPQLGGNLDLNGNDIEDASNPVLLAGQNSVRRAKQASKTSFIEEEYIHSISLLGSQTNTVISSLTFAHATIEALEITYKFKQSTSNNVRVGTIRVVTNGTAVVLNDVFTDSANTGISFSAAVNGANIEISYTSGTNGGTVRADVKKFLV